MTGCQCQILLSLKKRQWLPNVIFQHLPKQTVESWLKAGSDSAALTYFSKNSFFTSFFSVTLVSVSLLWRVKQFIALKAHMRIMFNFHHWSRKSCEAKAQQRHPWQIMCGLLSFPFTNVMGMRRWCSSKEIFMGSWKINTELKIVFKFGIKHTLTTTVKVGES